MRKAAILLMVLAAIALLFGGCSKRTVQEGDTVKVHYTLRLADGTQQETSKGGEPLTVKVGSGGTIEGFEKGLIGMEVGQVKTITVPPEEGYGPHRDDLVMRSSREQFPKDMDLEVGSMVQAQSPDGRTMPLKIVAIDGDTVTVDGNHPLAGQTLTFELELVGFVDEGGES